MSGCKKEAAKVNSFFPTVITTDTVTNISATTVTSGGEITAEGRTPVIARGVCWSTSRNPTIANSKTIDGTGTGRFTSTITGLTTGTTYYVRAYATNSIRRTGYGNEISFEINDYLPLKVGTKYKYNYSEGYSYIDGGYTERGECTWKFISKSVDSTVVYQVEQSFTGTIYRNYSGQKDTAHIENQISALSFEVQNDGKVGFHFFVPYFGAHKVTFERFIQSDKIDTCFLLTLYSQGCLRKNTGITDLDYTVSGNHHGSVSYSLIEGPTY